MNTLTGIQTQHFISLPGVPANGKRAYSISTLASGISDTLNYFSCVIHMEPNTMLQYLNINDEVANQTPNWHMNKSWYWEVDV